MRRYEELRTGLYAAICVEDEPCYVGQILSYYRGTLRLHLIDSDSGQLAEDKIIDIALETICDYETCEDITLMRSKHYTSLDYLKAFALDWTTQGFNGNH